MPRDDTAPYGPDIDFDADGNPRAAPHHGAPGWRPTGGILPPLSAPMTLLAALDQLTLTQLRIRAEPQDTEELIGDYLGLLDLHLTGPRIEPVPDRTPRGCIRRMASAYTDWYAWMSLCGHADAWCSLGPLQAALEHAIWQTEGTAIDATWRFGRAAAAVTFYAQGLDPYTRPDSEPSHFIRLGQALHQYRVDGGDYLRGWGPFTFADIQKED